VTSGKFFRAERVGSAMATEPDVEDVQAEVDRIIEDNDLVLFIKGTPDRPQCGFSQRAVGVLGRHREEFTTVNVLDGDLAAYREALEAHSGWDTIPQAYSEGEFVGGSDILVELHENGDLAEQLP
jgi:monothiol glutaredoxin